MKKSQQPYRRTKIDVQVNDWTVKKERLLRYWQEECRLYNWLYIQNVETYQQINKLLSLTSIILSSVTGTTLLNQSNETSSASNSRILIAFGIMSLLAGMISSFKEFMNLGAKINANINCARQNSCIVNDIDEQLNMERADRINGREFMKIIKDRKNDLIQNGPMIPRSKWNKLQKQINSGQGINFFNKKLFQEYMDQTINVGELDFHMPGEDDGSPDNPHTRTHTQDVGNPHVTTDTYRVQSTTINMQPTNIPSNSVTVTYAEQNSTQPSKINTKVTGIVSDGDNTSLAESAAAVAQGQSTTNATSEDEYIANMNDENLCAGTLRQMFEESEHIDNPVSPRRLFRFRNRNKHSVNITSPKPNNQDGYLSDPDLELGRSKTKLEVSNSSKYDPLLQYQLTRL